jgi:hypothetical protein
MLALLRDIYKLLVGPAGLAGHSCFKDLVYALGNLTRQGTKTLPDVRKMMYGNLPR